MRQWGELYVQERLDMWRLPIQYTIRAEGKVYRLLWHRNECWSSYSPTSEVWLHGIPVRAVRELFRRFRLVRCRSVKPRKSA
ncbi:MAG: hypothetical protein KGL39_23135 [Patescibacteria group bacterium]|nr:hypothetical protein [Patescibacteria group bacterium]